MPGPSWAHKVGLFIYSVSTSLVLVEKWTAVHWSVSNPCFPFVLCSLWAGLPCYILVYVVESHLCCRLCSISTATLLVHLHYSSKSPPKKSISYILRECRLFHATFWASAVFVVFSPQKKPCGPTVWSSAILPESRPTLWVPSCHWEVKYRQESWFLPGV